MTYRKVNHGSKGRAGWPAAQKCRKGERVSRVGHGKDGLPGTRVKRGDAKHPELPQNRRAN